MTRDHLDIIRDRYRSPPLETPSTPPAELVARYLRYAIGLHELRGRRILEIGAGCSQYARVFLENGCAAYYANDLIPERLAVSRIADPRYHELPGDILSIDPLPHVDIVFMNLTMMFLVPFMNRVVERAGTCMSPGGLLIDMEANYFCPLNVARRFGDLKPNPAKLFSPLRYAREVERRGFAIERLIPFTANHPRVDGNWLLGTNFWLRARKF